MPIPQADRKRLLKQIDMAEQYQKIRHTGHCSDDADCVTHCTKFSLSDQKYAQHQLACRHAHTLDCPDCMKIIHTLDEIGQKIEKITNSDVRQEAKYDFENASEHIVERPRDNLRATRQDVEKKLSVHSIGFKKSCCKSTANLKVNITEKAACRYSSDHSYGKIPGRRSPLQRATTVSPLHLPILLHRTWLP